MDKKLEVLNIQRQIKSELKKLNWSIPTFASRFLIATQDYDIEEYEVKAFEERVKKQLSRSTTNLELLKRYQSFIYLSDEYLALLDEGKAEQVVPLTGFIADYISLLNEERCELKRKVLEVAAAHALSVGTAWDFLSIQINADDYYDIRYITLWEGDIGHNGGSGTWGTAMCEVVVTHWGTFVVRRSEYYFKTGLRTVSEITGFNDGKLLLKGWDYDENDTNNHPSLEFEVELIETNGGWSLVKKVKISKYVETNAKVTDIGGGEEEWAKFIFEQSLFNLSID